MVEYDNTNKGALFRNTRRDKDSQPEYNGSVNVGGVDYWLSAWVKEGKSGKFFSLSVKPKIARVTESDSKLSTAELTGEDLPF